MRNGGTGGLVGRVVSLLGGIVFVVLLVRVLNAILRPILPAGVIGFLGSGVQTLYGYLNPAVPGIAALAVLAAVWWLVMGRR